MSSGNTALHKAIRNFKGDIRSIKNFLDHNDSEINVRNSAGETPIHKAVQNKACTIELLQLLMEYGADIHATTPLEGNTALHLLTTRSTFDPPYQEVYECSNLINLAEFLMLQLGHDVNTGNYQNDTMLHFYLKNFKVSLANHFRMLLYFFLKKACDFNAVNLTGETPLHLVVRDEVLCDVFLIKLLISLGADVGKRDRSGENVYDAYRKALKRGIREDYRLNSMLQMEVAQEDERQRYLNSSLHTACMYHNVDSVHKLLKLGVDVNQKDTLGHSPLYYALKAVIPPGKCNDNSPDCPKCQTVKLLLDYENDFKTQVFLDYGDSYYYIRINDICSIDEYHGHSSNRIFNEHLAKLLELRDKMEDVFSAMRNHTKLQSATSASRELNAMIETKIGKSAISFYNFLLLANAKEMAMYAKNKELVRAFHAGKVAFPLYQGMLDAKFARHLERRKLIESVAVWLWEILELVDPSHEIYEKILSYFSNEELNRLIDSNI